MLPARLNPLPVDRLQGLSERPRKCIERLSQYKRHETHLYNQHRDRMVVMLVLLYEKSGQLRALLTTRSKSLRTHAGKTSLPGGKVEASDTDICQAVHREAFEEVGMPQHSPDVQDICVLEPHFSSTRRLVVPVVALLTNPAILDDLRPSEREVAHIFDHPLEALLDPDLASAEPLVPVGSEHWPYEAIYHNARDVVMWESLGGGGIAYRLHSFRSRASPVEGLTADILIKTAEIAYGRPPAYECYAAAQPRDFTAAFRLVEAVAAA